MLRRCCGPPNHLSAIANPNASDRARNCVFLSRRQVSICPHRTVYLVVGLVSFGFCITINRGKDQDQEYLIFVWVWGAMLCDRHLQRAHVFVHSLHARCTGHCSNMFSLHRHLKLAAIPRVVLVRVTVLGVPEEEAALHTDNGPGISDRLLGFYRWFDLNYLMSIPRSSKNLLCH